MATDERNFRSSYYEKVGCRSVEEKKSLEILLKETPWDKSKLKQFCIRFTIPATYRNILWKVQLGILPAFTDSHHFVMEQRQAQYNDLLHALKIMRIVDNDTPKSRVFSAMFMLESGKLYYDFNLQQIDCGLAPLVESLLQMYDDDVDVYWLAKGFYHITEQFTKDIPRLVELTKNLLEKEDQDLYRYLIDKNILDNLPIEKWFNCCFAGILEESALAKIWDKICGGSSSILGFVAIVLFIAFKNCIMKCRDTEQVLKYVLDVPEETQEVIANKAIELWQQNGSMLPSQNESILKGKPDIHLR